MSRIAAGQHPAAAGAPSQTPCPASYPPAGGAHTLHLESGWDGWRIIHTHPDGHRSYWRRGIETRAEALLRAHVVEDMTGYEVKDG